MPRIDEERKKPKRCRHVTRLDLETLGSRSIMTKNFPGRCWHAITFLWGLGERDLLHTSIHICSIAKQLDDGLFPKKDVTNFGNCSNV